MTQFEDRERAFEAKFAHDSEMQFRAYARRNKLLGLWAAEKIGRKGTEAEAYARDVVAEFERKGEEGVYSKIAHDLESEGAPTPEAEVRAKMHELFRLAKAQLVEEAR